MRRVSLTLAVFVGAAISVEAFFGGMFVQRLLSADPAPDTGHANVSHEPDPELTRQLDEATLKLADLETEIKALRSQVKNGFVRDLDVVITKSQAAYPLVAPKLMISVHALHGGPVLAHFGTETHRFSVGQRVDFRVKDCFCYLLLLESVREKAVFHFGCERKNPDDTPLEVETQNREPNVSGTGSANTEVPHGNRPNQEFDPASDQTNQGFLES